MKTLKIVAMAAGMLLLSGCGNNTAQNSNSTGADNSSAPKTEEKGAVRNVMSSIKDAMASGETMQCTYTIKDEKGGEIVSTMFVDGKKYSGTTTIAGHAQHMVFDGEAMYSWADGQKQGMKMTTACSAELAANAPKSQNENAPEVTAADPKEIFDNATNVKCEPSVGADFSIPSDVILTDQCEMLKNVMRNVPTGANMPKGIPANIPAGI